MKTLLEIDENVLIGYKQLKKLNPDGWDVSEYLNLKYDINSAVAFSKLYFPDFIEIDGCVILSFRFDKEIFYEWKQKFGDRGSEIERMCNFYEVGDYFHLNNNSEYNSEEELRQAIIQLANILKVAWELNLKILYPKRNFKVDVFEDYGTTRITLYSSS